MVRQRTDSCPDDLLARRQRGPLSQLEQRALDAHLGQCGGCRAVAAFGASFDDATAAPADDHGHQDGHQDGHHDEHQDGQLIARVARRIAFGEDFAAPKVVAARTNRRGATPAVAVAIALMLAGGAAAAWVALRPPRAPAPVAATAAHPAGVAHARATASSIPRGEPAPTAAAIAENPAAAPPMPPRALASASRGTRGAPAVASTGAGAPSAGDLFARANSFRRTGDLSRAISLYRHLQARFPGSTEASLSFVSLGEVLSRRGETAAALAAFEGYLAQRSSGPLAQEALFGAAGCLERMGRGADERDTWNDLLRRFPGSVYERAARRRLAELAR